MNASLICKHPLWFGDFKSHRRVRFQNYSQANSLFNYQLRVWNTAPRSHWVPSP